MEELLERASLVHAENFDDSLTFERSVFINWSCALADCTYCYLSTQPKAKTYAKRSNASILAEILICKELGWRVDYITGGIGVHSLLEQKELFSLIKKVYGEAVCVNLGPMSEKHFEMLSGNIAGVGVAIESFIPSIQEKICPSKPHPPFIKTLKISNSLGLRNVITIILGLGERKEDYPILEKFIRDNSIQKIQFCFLKPQKGTIHENQLPPSSSYAAWWIAKTRCTFPSIKLKIAITEDRIPDLPLLCKAGINTFSRFPVIKKFGRPIAFTLEKAISASGRLFTSTFTTMPSIDWDGKVDGLEIEDSLKEQIRVKLHEYLKKMKPVEVTS